MDAQWAACLWLLVPTFAKVPAHSERCLKQTYMGAGSGSWENVRWVLSVEKDHGLTGWILTALEWISPGLSPCMAAAHQLWRLVLFIPASHLCWGDTTCQWWQTGAFPQPAGCSEKQTILNQGKKGRGRSEEQLVLSKCSTHTCWTSQTTTWGPYLEVWPDLCRQWMSPCFLWAGTPWASRRDGSPMQSSADGSNTACCPVLLPTALGQRPNSARGGQRDSVEVM